MISFELHLEKWHEKTQKPLWFLGFPNRYLFRFALLVGSAGVDESLTGGFLIISSAARFAVPEKIFGLTLILDFFDRCTALGSLHLPPAALPTLTGRATLVFLTTRRQLRSMLP